MFDYKPGSRVPFSATVVIPHSTYTFTVACRPLRPCNSLRTVLGCSIGPLICRNSDDCLTYIYSGALVTFDGRSLQRRDQPVWYVWAWRG